ncbi:UNVERIFIED_CONTAM: RNA polymerase sigma factor, partial [Hammondia hammondi]
MDQFEQGVWASRRLLKNYALKNIGHADDADDLVSQTMVNALANRKRFDGRNLEGWLMTILKNLIRD